VQNFLPKLVLKQATQLEAVRFEPYTFENTALTPVLKDGAWKSSSMACDWTARRMGR
jgi:hypothetical protein